jgi:hypothetical protein
LLLGVKKGEREESVWKTPLSLSLLQLKRERWEKILSVGEVFMQREKVVDWRVVRNGRGNSWRLWSGL